MKCQRPLHSLAVCISLMLLCLSCQDPYTQYREEFKNFEKGYASEDIRIAEQALKHFRARMVHLKGQGDLDVDFDHVLAVANARLSYLYSNLGLTNEAELYFVAATNHMNMPAKRGETDYPPLTRKEVYKIVEYADSYLDIKWKRQLKPNK